MKQLFSIIFLLLVFLSCKKEGNIYNDSTSFDRSYKLTDVSLNFKVDVFFTEGEMLPTSQEQKENLIQYFKNKFPEKKFDKVNKIEGLIFEEITANSKKDIVTIVLDAELEEIMKVPLAVEFHTPLMTGDGLTLRNLPSITSTASGRVTHTCAGDDCSCCRFQYGEFGLGFYNRKIAGCICIQGPQSDHLCLGDGICNHTITTTE